MGPFTAQQAEKLRLFVRLRCILCLREQLAVTSVTWVRREGYPAKVGHTLGEETGWVPWGASQNSVHFPDVFV